MVCQININLHIKQEEKEHFFFFLIERHKELLTLTKKRRRYILGELFLLYCFMTWQV